jgi:hypothetical protein
VSGASIDGGSIVRIELLRTGVPLAILAGLVAGGCVDSGLPGENLPLEDARTRPLVYDLYDEGQHVGPVHYDDRDWLVAGPAIMIGDALLSPVPAAGADVFALASDTGDHARLYIRTVAGMVPLAPVAVQGEAPPAAEAEHH